MSANPNSTAPISGHDPELLSELNKLDQFSHIKPEHISSWTQRVLEVDPERKLWHARRLSGFGGSEIGVLVGALRGYYHPFSSATKICADKLLRSLPELPNGDMLRGQELEDLVVRPMYRKQILSLYPQAKARDDIIEKLKDFRDPERPWLIGTPDEVIELEPGKIWIVDYKCPNPDVLATYDTAGVPFYYAAQLHHYKLIAEKMGFEIAGLQLASLHYKKWNVDLRDVPFDPGLTQECLFAGDHFWDKFVMRGAVPPTQAGRSYGEAEDIHENLRELAVLYTLYKSLGNLSVRTGEKITEVIADQKLSLAPGVDQVNVGLVDIKADREFNIPAMAQELQNEGIDLASVTEKGQFSNAKLLAFAAQQLLNQNIDPEKIFEVVETDPAFDQFRDASAISQKQIVSLFRQLGRDIAPHITSESVRLGLSRSQSEYAEHMSGKLKDELRPLIKGAVESLRDRMITFESDWRRSQAVSVASKRKNTP